MEISPEQQIFEQLRRASRVVIALPENTLSADGVAGALALKQFLEKEKKDVLVVTSGKLPKATQFLPHAKDIKSEIGGSQSFVVSVDTSVKPLDEISYETTPNAIKIFLKAKNGNFAATDVSFEKEKPPIDLVIILEAENLQDLGKVFEQNPEVFFETPKINIDHKPSNQFFGAVNLVDLSATSVSEILAQLFEKYEQQLVDEDIATCLLAGIIFKTDSFQHVKTTPRSFLTASQLIAFGGRQQEVVKFLYKTKSLGYLRLLGRCLAKLKELKNQIGVFAVLSRQDFEKAESNLSEIPEVIREMVSAVTGQKILAILAENQQGDTEVFLAMSEQMAAMDIKPDFGPMQEHWNNGFGFMHFSWPNITIAQSETKFLEAVEKI